MNSSEALSVIAAKSDLLLFTYDLKELKFNYLNPASEVFFKRMGENIPIASIINLVHVEDREYIKKCFIKLKEGIDQDEIEFRVSPPGNTEKWLKLSAFLIDEQPDGPMIVGHAENITEYKEVAIVLNKFSNKKNSILNILSHDLANPLGLISNVSQLLDRRLKSHEDEEVHKLLEMVCKVSKRATSLIQDFVKQEFLESSEASVVKNRVDLVEKVQHSIEEYRTFYERKVHARIHFEHSNEKVFLMLDETKFLQVVNNLISNATKFTPEDGTIVVSVEEKEETVLVKVADTGIGIPEKFHATLFDKFTNARRSGLDGEPSVGLGMSIIKTIVEWHQGKIWFESEENKGTTFYIELPKE